MNQVLENDENRAIVRTDFTPLSELNTEPVFTRDIGILAIVYRYDFNLSEEQFLRDLPVGRNW